MKRHLPYLPIMSLLAACGTASSPTDKISDECKGNRVWDPSREQCVESAQDASLEDAVLDVDATVPTRFPGIIYFSSSFEGELANHMFQFDTESRKASSMVNELGGVVDISNFDGERFSPQFTKLAYVAHDSELPANTMNSNVMIYNLQTGELVKVTPTYHATQLAWEDENKLLFSSYSETEGHQTRTIYRWSDGNVVPLKTFPLQNMIINLDVIDFGPGIKNVLAYNCVPPTKMRMAEEHKDDYNTQEINFPQELCFADIRGNEFFPMSITNLANSEYELVQSNLQWDNGDGPELELVNPNQSAAVYTNCKKKGENMPWQICVWGYANERPFFEVPFPQSGYEMRSFIVSPDHKSFLLDMENFWDRRDNSFVQVGYEYGVVDGKKLGRDSFRVVAFKPQ